MIGSEIRALKKGGCQQTCKQTIFLHEQNLSQSYFTQKVRKNCDNSELATKKNEI